MERKNAWKAYSDEQITELEEVNKSYREFLTVGKTERECVKEIIKQAEATGYQSLQSFMEQGRALQKGDKVYAVCMNKSVAMFQIGEQPLEQGMNILGAHIDSPRLDVKQNPLYEDSDMAYLDTHYYGGIKKYQWVTLPLAIHGVVVKKNGETVDICIGEKEDDPVFCVTDLLIHLAGTQMEKKAAKVIEGEKLDLLIGSMPLKDEEKDAVKANVLKLLQDQYGMEEEDFISAELEIVPESNPFASKIICGDCNKVFARKGWRSSTGVDRKVWQCSERYKVKGVMGCANRHVEEETLIKAYLMAWNALVENREDFMEQWTEQLQSEKLLEGYRAEKFIEYTDGAETLTEMDTDFMLKTLDHIKVFEDGTLLVVFLDGTEIECKNEEE